MNVRAAGLWGSAALFGCGPTTDVVDPVDTDRPGVASASVRINEVVSKNQSGAKDGDGDTSDWIELYNASDAAVDLAGWRLSGDGGAPFVFPAVSLAAGEFLVVWASGKGPTGPPGELHAPFKVSSDGEGLRLVRETGLVVDSLAVPRLAADRSYGLSEPVTTATLLTSGATGTLRDAPTGDWTTPGFDDAAWLPVVVPVGFDGTVVDGLPAERAFGRLSEQSSSYGGIPAWYAVDGDPSTFSHTDTGDLDPWWQVTLDAAYAVSEITLVNRYDCCAERLYNVTVHLLDDDGATTWRSETLFPTAEGESPANADAVITLRPEGGPIGRRVRVEKAAVNGVYSSEWLSLAEVAVVGTESVPYAKVLETDVSGAVASASVGLRVPFVLDAAAPTRASLRVAYDDGFVASVDGREVASANAGAPVAHAGTTSERLPVDLRGLVAGTHLFAARIDNVAAGDDDLLFAPTLEAEWFVPGEPAHFAVPTPNAPNGLGSAGPIAAPAFDPPRGFYDDPLSVTITAAAGASLVVTTDGTPPTATNGRRIDPASGTAVASLSVPVGTTAMLRAAAIRAGWDDSPVATHTYLFLDDVLRQPAAPDGFPATWNSRLEGAYAADYEMDPEVTSAPATRSELRQGLRDLPTLSIVTGVADLFGDDGIYANSVSRGDEWERRVSVEWIETDGSTGFQQDAKLQIHGYGWRYHSNTLKHSFRLEFQREYGAAKLEWPMFEDAPVDRFDSIVLRAGGSKTWLDFRDPAQAQYLHDAFARDTARDMGKVDGHATYVHLYLDGLYWGLYMPVERPDADFAAEYFGGDAADYDAINRRASTNEAIDGDLAAYEAMLALSDEDVSTDAGLAALEAYLDVDDLIDWMLIHQYITNHDGPCCFDGNNQRGVRKREEGAKFKFFVWDMEYSLWSANENVNVDVDIGSHASHIYRRLWSNASFRARYAARARALLTGDGALTPAAASARYEARADQISSALLAESARWGDTYRVTPYTRDVEWLAEYTRLQEEYFPYRTDVLIEQLREVGLYTE